MIKVKPIKIDNIESYKMGFIVEGHAQFAPHGQDIVCAGVSALVQTTILGLEYYTYVITDIGSGYTKVHVTHDDHTSDAIIKTMLLGLDQLATQYPEHIKLKKIGETM